MVPAELPHFSALRRFGSSWHDLAWPFRRFPPV